MLGGGVVLKCVCRLHENNQVTELSNPLHVKRRLRRQWPSDLIVEREEEE
jgi:hypothetical protein